MKTNGNDQLEERIDSFAMARRRNITLLNNVIAHAAEAELANLISKNEEIK